MTVSVAKDGRPYQFRLLNDRLTGFVWPRWVRAGERAELMFHALEPYRLSLWRYGRTREFVRILGWWDEHGPDANMQITPDGDYTQTGVRFNKVGYGNPHHTQLVTAPAAGGLYYVEAEGESGAFFAAPWVVAPAAGREAAAAAPVAVVMSTNTWNAYNNFGGRSNYVNSTGLPAEPTVYGRQELTRYKPQSAADWAAPDEAFLPLTFERPEPFNSVLGARVRKIRSPAASRTTSRRPSGGCSLGSSGRASPTTSTRTRSWTTGRSTSTRTAWW